MYAESDLRLDVSPKVHLTSFVIPRIDDCSFCLIHPYFLWIFDSLFSLYDQRIKDLDSHEGLEQARINGGKP